MINIHIDAHRGEGRYKTIAHVVQGLLIHGLQAPCHLFVYDKNSDMREWKVFDELGDVPVHYVDLRPCFLKNGIDGEKLREILTPLSDQYSPTVVVFSLDRFPLGDIITSSGDLYWQLLLQEIERYCDERWGRDAHNPVYLIN